MKRDIKYIIKRVIIGVLIGVIFAFINKFSVKAEELPNAYVNLFGFNLNEITSSPWGSNYITLGYFDYSNNKININNASPGLNSAFYSLFKDNNDNYYLLSSNFSKISSFDSVNFTSSGIQYLNNETLVSSSQADFLEFRIFSTNNINNNFIYQELTTNINYNAQSIYNNNYNSSFNYNILNFANNSSDIRNNNIYNFINYITENLTLVDSSISLYIDSQAVDFLPSNYESIELNDYQAVYFVPKNYNNIPTINVPNNCTIGTDDPCVEAYKFDYYYSGDIKQAYFSLENTNILIQEYSYTNSSDDYELVNTFYSKEEEINNITYNYFSPLLYNANYLYSSTIWYDSTLYDYYIINDMTNYQENICFIGKENTEICLDIVFSKTLEDYWKEGFSTGGSDFNDSSAQDFKTFIGGITGIFSIPYDFFTRLNNSSCSSLTFPIPFTNGSANVECLSPIWKRVLGSFYDTIVLLLNGLIVYRITILNIQCITDVLSLKSDDKLEVVEL